MGAAGGAAAVLGAGLLAFPVAGAQAAPAARGAVPAGAARAGAAGATGAWGKAIEVPGLWTPNEGGNAGVSSVSCSWAGNCAATGTYSDHAGHPAGFRGFVASERNGRSDTAIQAPGLGALNTADFAGASSVSCGSAGTCVAGGFYSTGTSGQGQGFVVSEENGVWGAAIEVPGLAALNKFGRGTVISVSCAPPGNCTAGGFYTDGRSRGQGFVVSQS